VHAASKRADSPICGSPLAGHCCEIQIPRHHPYRLLGELCDGRCATGATRPRSIAQRKRALACGERLSDICDSNPGLSE
jgi:hypothetical protein